MALRLSGLRFDAVCRPDKAFTPPSGMLVGMFTVGRIRRYAAIRHVGRDIHCRPDKAFTPPSGMLVGMFTVGRIRRLRRHPACWPVYSP